MTLRSVLLALSIALAGGLLAPAAAQACSCSTPGPPCVAFPKTPVVFTGRVTQQSEIRISQAMGYLVRFEVEQDFREQRTFIDVATGDGGGVAHRLARSRRRVRDVSFRLRYALRARCDHRADVAVRAGTCGGGAAVGTAAVIALRSASTLNTPRLEKST